MEESITRKKQTSQLEGLRQCSYLKVIHLIKAVPIWIALYGIFDTGFTNMTANEEDENVNYSITDDARIYTNT